MNDTHDEHGGDEAAEVAGLLRSLPRTKITPENVTQHLIDRWYREKSEYLDEIRDLREQLTAVTGRHDRTARTADRLRYHAERYRARTEEAGALPRIADGITAAEAEASATFDLTIDEVRALKADRDAATVRAEEAAARIEQLRQTITDANSIIQAQREDNENLKVRLADDTDSAGWTAEENAAFEKRYGVKAAMRLRAANDRVWTIVQELRTAAVEAGRDPHQDPMAQRLSAALVGVGGGAVSGGWTDYGDGWSSRRPDASLDGLRGPFTGLIGPFGTATDAAPSGRACGKTNRINGDTCARTAGHELPHKRGPHIWSDNETTEKP
jgi:hypothetical protein